MCFKRDNLSNPDTLSLITFYTPNSAFPLSARTSTAPSFPGSRVFCQQALENGARRVRLHGVGFLFSEQARGGRKAWIFSDRP